MKGQYSASYLSPFVRIAPHMAAQGFALYIVNSVSTTSGGAAAELLLLLLR